VDKTVLNIIDLDLVGRHARKDNYIPDLDVHFSAPGRERKGLQRSAACACETFGALNPPRSAVAFVAGETEETVTETDGHHAPVPVAARSIRPPAVILRHVDSRIDDDRVGVRQWLDEHEIVQWSQLKQVSVNRGLVVVQIFPGHLIKTSPELNSGAVGLIVDGQQVDGVARQDVGSAPCVSPHQEQPAHLYLFALIGFPHPAQS
jgi:hypothetical protein